MPPKTARTGIPPLKSPTRFPIAPTFGPDGLPGQNAGQFTPFPPLSGQQSLPYFGPANHYSHLQFVPTPQHEGYSTNMSASQQQLQANLVVGQGEGMDTPSARSTSGGCCSSHESSLETSRSASAQITPRTSDEGPIVQSPLPNNNNSGEGVRQDSFPAFPNGSQQTSMYHIPVDIATYQHPMTPEQQAILQQSRPGYMHEGAPAHLESGLTGPAATTHLCRCGDGCQCIACPVHPFNAPMQARMAEICQLLENEPPSSFTPEVFSPSKPWARIQRSSGEDFNSSQYPRSFPIAPDMHGFHQPPSQTYDQNGAQWNQPGSNHNIQHPFSDPHFNPVDHAESATSANAQHSAADGGNNTAPSQAYLHFEYPSAEPSHTS